MSEENWIYFDVSIESEEKAIKIREERDKLYGNIYDEKESDLRWVGDLGEIWFNKWIKECGITGFKWHQDNAAGKPDFTINDIRVDIKTIKRQGPPKPYYTAQITSKHVTHPIDELFFMSYEYKVRRLWFLGGIKLKDFVSKAKYYKEGDAVHSNYVVRKGHEIYNAEIALLELPNNWIKKLMKNL